MMKKEMIAMLLAGGQGSRLGVLTAKVAKPAVLSVTDWKKLAIILPEKLILPIVSEFVYSIRNISNAPPKIKIAVVTSVIFV